jgi:hypothetical protein
MWTGRDGTAAMDSRDPVTPDVAVPAGPLVDQELVWEACDSNNDGPPLPERTCPMSNALPR